MQPFLPFLPLLFLTALTTAQPNPGQSICDYLFGSNYTDACCDSIYSRGPDSPCDDIQYVGNLTECTVDAFPYGWCLCVEKDPPSPQLGPRYYHTPSGCFSTNTTTGEQDKITVDGMAFSS